MQDALQAKSALLLSRKTEVSAGEGGKNSKERRSMIAMSRSDEGETCTCTFWARDTHALTPHTTYSPLTVPQNCSPWPFSFERTRCRSTLADNSLKRRRGCRKQLALTFDPSPAACTSCLPSLCDDLTKCSPPLPLHSFSPRWPLRTVRLSAF